jgi:glycosyltransferase involved in cell wall biosynthesis
MKVLIYMPALNEADSIVDVLKSLPKELSGVDEISYLVVDDASTDLTAELAKENGAVVISHKVRKRVGGAFQTALKYTLDNGFDILVSTDADRQFNLEQIPDLINPILQGTADMVTGNRFVNGMPTNMPKIKFWGNKQMAGLISLITGQNFQDVSCGFRAYGKEALLNLNLMGGFTYTQESILDLLYKGLTVVEVPIDVVYFVGRKSRVAGSVINYALKTSSIIVASLRDSKPMFFFGGVGVFLGVIGALSTIVLTVNDVTLQSGLSVFEWFVALVLILLGGVFFVTGLLANMFLRIRANQDRILYQMKSSKYENDNKKHD